MTGRILDEPLDLDALLRETRDEACGGVSVFAGTVREENRGRRVEWLEYEAQVPVAERVLRELEEEVLERFEARRCRIQHRVGRLEPGETSVLVVVRAPHRADAFAGCRHAIDELKGRLPVWKEERYTDGSSHWLEGTSLSTESSVETGEAEG